MFNYILMTVLCLSDVCSYIIDYPSTIMLKTNLQGSHFGYSILLQRGNPSIAIVGAPRGQNNNKITGDVYKCDLSSQTCSKYYIKPSALGIYVNGKNGDFLGASLDGDDKVGGTFITCAPRFTAVYDFSNYFTTGRCFRLKNSTLANTEAELILPLNHSKVINTLHGIGSTSYYDAAFAQSGFDIKYVKEDDEVIFGAPGKASMTGAVIRSNLFTYRSNTLSLKLSSNDHYRYFGYAVSSGHFIEHSKEVWYVGGAPRGNKLKGMVVLFERSTRNEDITTKEELLGEQFGSYFGASLLVVQHKDGGDDILIGAPMHSGNSWDEGCVYYYKNKGNGNFHLPLKLLGRQPGSRFGQVLANLGDIDLDSYPDVAIAAPYEDDGMGAVYLYFGTKEGFSSSNYHRISPSSFKDKFSGLNVKGFGMGVSRGNDLRSIGHNDFAVGAYKSGQVFLLHPFMVFDLTEDIVPSVKTLYTSTSNFSVHYCLSCKARNRRTFVLKGWWQLNVPDDRVLGSHNITKAIKLVHNVSVCNNHTITLRKNFLNVEPLVVKLLVNVDPDHVWKTRKTIEIPVSYGCGEDNLCQTDLSLTASPVKSNFVIPGLDNELRVNLTIENHGEAAYQTKLFLGVPPQMNLINLRECDFENENYVCLLAEKVTSQIQKSFLLDLGKFDLEMETLEINFTVTSLGIDVSPDNNQLLLSVPVRRESHLFINSESRPDGIVWDKVNDTATISHVFRISNKGPSATDLNLTILLPHLVLENKTVFDIHEIQGTINDVVVQCNESGIMPEEEVENLVSTVKLNKTNSLSCFENGSNCSKIVCQGGRLFKSSESTVFSVTFVTHLDLLSKVLEQHDTIISSVAFINNGTKITESVASTPVYGLSRQLEIPFWIYTISVVGGLLLLSLLIYCLYRCNFFKRTYKERLDNERGEGILELSEQEQRSEEN